MIWQHGAPHSIVGHPEYKMAARSPETFTPHSLSVYQTVSEPYKHHYSTNYNPFLFFSYDTPIANMHAGVFAVLVTCLACSGYTLPTAHNNGAPPYKRQDIGGTLSGLTGGLTEGLTGGQGGKGGLLGDGLVPGVVKRETEGATGALSGATRGATDEITDTASGAIDDVTGAAGDATGEATDAASGATGAAGDAAREATGEVTDAATLCPPHTTMAPLHTSARISAAPSRV
jgi:uncharacterized protein YjbJ (UPF0337 family)